MAEYLPTMTLEERAQIPQLYRHLDNFDAVISHIEGQLWFRTFRYFRSLEDDVRRDSEEGRASGTIDGGMHLSVANDDFPTQPVYILCFSENASCTAFGEHVVEVADPTVLQRRVQDALPQNARVAWHKVVYSDQSGYPEEPSPIDILNRAECTKPCRFAGEREWRLVIRMAPDLKITNDCLQLDVGELDDVLSVFHTRQTRKSYDPDGLKPLSKVYDQDERNAITVVLPSGSPITLKAFYETIAIYELAPSVPRDVHIQFDLARNLFVYGSNS